MFRHITFFLLVAIALGVYLTLEIVWLISSIHVMYSLDHSNSSRNRLSSYHFSWLGDHEDHVGFLVTGKVFSSTSKGQYCGSVPIDCVDASLV